MFTCIVFYSICCAHSQRDRINQQPYLDCISNSSDNSCDTTNYMQSYVYIDFVRQVRIDAIWRFFLIISESASDKAELPEENRHLPVSKGHSTQTKGLGATRPYSVCAHSRSCQK